MSQRDIVLSFGGAGEQRIGEPGTAWRIIEATGDVFIRFIGAGGAGTQGGEIKRVQGDGGTDAFQDLIVRSAVAQTVRLAVGDREILLAANLNANVSATVGPGSNYKPTPDVSVAGDSSAEVIAANLNRLTVTIGNPASNTQQKRLGVSGNVGADRGDILEPGESMTKAITGAMWVHNIGASSESVTVSEVIE